MLKDAIRYLFWRWRTRKNHRRRWVLTQGASIHVQIVGDGPTLVLLHGGLSSSLDWYLLLPELSLYFRLILIDFRGHGRSTLGSVKPSYDTHVSDVLAVMDSLELNKVDIAGWSDGGITGLLLAREHAERIGRLVAISANINADGLTTAATRTIQSLTVNSGNRLARWLRALQTTEPERWPELWQSVAPNWLKQPAMKFDELALIETRTLLIVGSRDDVSVEHVRQMAAAMPVASMVVIPDTPHRIPQTASTELIRLMVQFLHPQRADGR